MLSSKEKLADMQERQDCMELMELMLRKGFVEEAKKYGELSRFYAERIKKNDYEALDKKWEIYHKLQTI